MIKTKPRKKVSQDHVFYDAVGRRRKLSYGAMVSIMNAYATGTSTMTLAEMHGVSTTTIRAVVYHTPRQADLQRMAEGKKES